MNHPALKGEVSINKMSIQINPRLRRFNVVSDSLGGCVTNATKELSRAPEMSFSEIFSKPRMFMQKFEGGISFKQLQGFANTHRRGKLNKQVDVIKSNVEFVNFEPFSVSNLSQEKFAIHSDSVKLHGVFGIFALPHKVESVLSKAMFSGFQIHFLSPEHSSNYVQFNSGGLVSRPSDPNHLTELNLWNSGNSSLGLKAEVSLPRM